MRKALVAVGIVDRHRNENNRIEYVGARRAREIAQHRQKRFLSLYLTRVNVPLYVDDRTIEPARLIGRGNTRPRSNYIWYIAPFVCPANRAECELRPPLQ